MHRRKVKGVSEISDTALNKSLTFIPMSYTLY